MRTRDVEGLARFYVDRLGFEAVRRDASTGSVWLDAGGAVIMIERADDEEPAIDPWSMELVAFAVEDKEVWRARLEGEGVRIEGETEHTLYFRDPEGRRLGVSVYRWGE